MRMRSWVLTHIIMPYFLETGPSIAEILWFFDFPNSRCRYHGFLNSQNFTGCQSPEGLYTSPFQISSKLVNLFWRYCNIYFLRWQPPPFWIFEIAKFYWLTGSRGSRCMSVPNIVKICQSVAKILRFFKMVATAILNFQIWMMTEDTVIWCWSYFGLYTGVNRTKKHLGLARKVYLEKDHQGSYIFLFLRTLIDWYSMIAIDCFVFAYIVLYIIVVLYLCLSYK